MSRGQGPGVRRQGRGGGSGGGRRNAHGTFRHHLAAVLATITCCLSTACIANGELVTQQLFQDARTRQERRAVPTPTDTPTPVPPTETPTPTRTPAPGREMARVIRVWDGNTVEIQGGHSVRYIGVATPGAGMFRRPVEPFGREAAERNIALVEGKEIEIEADQTDLDTQGIMLRYVYVDGEMVNETLLREGLARLAPFGRNTRYAAQLTLAEQEARRTPIHIWTLATYTPTPTLTPTITNTPTNTRTPTMTPIHSPTPRESPTPRPSPTLRPSPTPQPVPTSTETPVPVSTPEVPTVEPTSPPTPVILTPGRPFPVTSIVVTVTGAASPTPTPGPVPAAADVEADEPGDET